MCHCQLYKNIVLQGNPFMTNLCRLATMKRTEVFMSGVCPIYSLCPILVALGFSRPIFMKFLSPPPAACITGSGSRLNTCGRTDRPIDKERNILTYGKDEDNRRFFAIILLRLKCRGNLLFSPSNFRISGGHKEK